MKRWFVNRLRRAFVRGSRVLDLVIWILPLGLLVVLLAERVTRWRKRLRRPRRVSPMRERLRARLYGAGLDPLNRFLDVARPSEKARQRLRKMLYVAGHRLMGTGDLTLAARCFEGVLRLTAPDSKGAMHDYRVLGAAHFMRGDLPAAHRSLHEAGRARARVLARGAVCDGVRFLGPGWFVAIGHVCMLDFYFKKRLLGWGGSEQAVMMTDAQYGSAPGRDLLLAFREQGLQIVPWQRMPNEYDRRRAAGALRWSMLNEEEQFAAFDDFWEYDFGDGEILTYTHGAARIQQRWEAEGRPALLSLGAGQRAHLEQLLRELGVPRGAWYVCLHVREPGFHARWNSIYPSARDAEVTDYDRAIRAIRERGGWVVRVGDPSMKRLPPQEGVVDYAHSPFKTPLADILLPAGCRFFLGTNSGYATVPGIYGVPNVLTNWVPVSLPLWFGIDLMIPKPFYDCSRGAYVDFDTLFGTPLGAMQNSIEFPAHIEVRSNTPEQIEQVVVEMLDRLDGRSEYTAEDERLQDAYHALAVLHGAYRGSRIGREFLREYADLLKFPASCPDEPTQHAVAPDRRAAVSVAP